MAMQNLHHEQKTSLGLGNLHQYGDIKRELIPVESDRK
jgi:hypothetical protein